MWSPSCYVLNSSGVSASNIESSPSFYALPSPELTSVVLPFTDERLLSTSVLFDSVAENLDLSLLNLLPNTIVWFS